MVVGVIDLGVVCGNVVVFLEIEVDDIMFYV